MLQGKESVAVDIHTDDGRDIVHELVRHADAVLVSFRAGVVERLGLDADDAARVNPDLVYLERARLRRRRSVRPSARVRADHRRRLGPGDAQHRRVGTPRSRSRRRGGEAGRAAHRAGRHGRRPRRRLLRARRGDRAPARTPGPATRRTRTGDADLDAAHHGPRARRGHGRVRRGTDAPHLRPWAPRAFGARYRLYETAERLGVPRRAGAPGEWEALATALAPYVDLAVRPTVRRRAFTGRQRRRPRGDPRRRVPQATGRRLGDRSSSHSTSAASRSDRAHPTGSSSPTVASADRTAGSPTSTTRSSAGIHG